MKYSAEDLKKFQDNDPDLSVIINWLETEKLPTESELALSSPCVKHLWLHRGQLSFHKDVLYYQWEVALEPKRLFLVQSSLKSEIIENFHDHSYAGHMGRDNTRRNKNRYIGMAYTAMSRRMLQSVPHVVRKRKPINAKRLV